MTSLTIQNLDELLAKRLQLRAAAHGRSIEDEAHEILRQTIEKTQKDQDLGRAIHKHFAAIGGIDLDLPPREPMREPPFGA